MSNHSFYDFCHFLTKDCAIEYFTLRQPSDVDVVILIVDFTVLSLLLTIMRLKDNYRYELFVSKAVLTIITIIRRQFLTRRNTTEVITMSR